MIGCVLQNVATGRFHPIFFRVAPMPSGADSDAGMLRYKSKMHHTEGYDTHEDAIVYGKKLCTENNWTWDDRVIGWTGEGIPAMVEWFQNPPVAVAA